MPELLELLNALDYFLLVFGATVGIGLGGLADPPIAVVHGRMTRNLTTASFAWATPGRLPMRRALRSYRDWSSHDPR